MKSESIGSETGAAEVASLVEAWIEVSTISRNLIALIVASLVEAWIEVNIPLVYYSISICRFPSGSVD